MRAAFEYAVRPMMYIKTNPVIYAKTPKGSRKVKRREIVSKENINRILERFEGTAFICR